MRSTLSHSPSGITIFHESKLSIVVPHLNAFLPPAFIATFPPIVQASCEVGSTANTKLFAVATSLTRLVITPAPTFTLRNPSCVLTALIKLSFSVLITAVCVFKGIAPPV